MTLRWWFRIVLKEGMRAPDFAAELHTGEIIHLSSILPKHKLVLFFYPRDFTPGCSTEVCLFRDRFEELEQLHARVLGVSRDSRERHLAFAQRFNLHFPLISDLDGRITRKYGADRFGGLFGLTRRMTVVISNTGVVSRIIRGEMSMSKHVDGAIDALRELATWDETRAKD